MKQEPATAFITGALGGLLMTLAGVLGALGTATFFPAGILGLTSGQPTEEEVLGSSAIAILSGVVVVVLALLVYRRPSEAPKWGILILALSIISLFGTGIGGFVLGAVLTGMSGWLARSYRGEEPVGRAVSSS